MSQNILTKEELGWIIIVVIIAAFIIALTEELTYTLLNFLMYLLISGLIILTSVISKKIAAPFYSIKIKYKIWNFQRYWFYEKSYFKKPFPIGLILPFFLTLFSLGIIKPLTFLQFDYKNYPQKRILKKYGPKNRRKTEINDADPAFTAAWGFYALLLLAMLGVIISSLFDLKFGTELTKYSVYYGLWNLIPISNLDGSKLFFGSILSWAFISILYIAFLILIIIL